MGDDISYQRCGSVSEPEQYAAERVPRRHFMNTIGAIGMGLVQSGDRSAARSDPHVRCIDVHHHFLPDAYFAFERAHGRSGNGMQWTLANDLADMDQNGT